MANFSVKKMVNYWLDGVNRKWETILVLKKAGKYADCLFFCHLVLEYLLKALVNIETKNQAPYIHDLVKLAELAKLDLISQQINLLNDVNLFNIRARYADIKYDFYKKATASYTQKYFKECDQMRLWLLKELQKKMPKNSQ